MPVLDVSELNIVLGVLGTFTVLYGIASVKIKQAWYLGEALPAVLFGIILGPLAAKFIESEKWGSATGGQTSAISLGVTRVMIGIQLLIAGYQLPAKYNLTRWKEMALCLIPVMTVMWLCATACIMLTIPKMTFLTALVIAACVTGTDPILSQAIAKGPFADKYVARPLREIISSEAGANSGVGFLFLMLATYLIRYADVDGAEAGDSANAMVAGTGEVGRLGGGCGEALKEWVVDTWLYTIVLSIAYGAFVGRWVDNESYVLLPTALGLFIIGTCGALGIDDLLACFVAGNALNWDGHYHRETELRYDEVNSCVNVLLNLGGFMYIGAVLPWADFNDPTGTGITWSRLFVLGLLVLIFRRLPAMFAFYKVMPAVCASWKDALFMGYFGPIGAGAVFFVEHARRLFPEDGEGDEEETNLVRAMGPTVYWLVLLSVVVHGLSIPALNIFYYYTGKTTIDEDAVEIRRASLNAVPPANAVEGDGDTIIAYNRFSQLTGNRAVLPIVRAATGVSDDDPDKAPRFKVEQGYSGWV
ncbi:hypothetical protein ACJ41O_010341 [Fusarium nematophilum]